MVRSRQDAIDGKGESFLGNAQQYWTAPIEDDYP